MHLDQQTRLRMLQISSFNCKYLNNVKLRVVRTSELKLLLFGMHKVRYWGWLLLDLLFGLLFVWLLGY